MRLSPVPVKAAFVRKRENQGTELCQQVRVPLDITKHLQVVASFLTGMHACVSRNDKRQGVAALFPPARPQEHDAELSAQAGGSAESASEELYP